MSSSGLSTVLCLSSKFNGLGLITGSSVREHFRLMDATLEESSMYFSCSVLFYVKGLGTGGLRQAPLNFTINKRPPMRVTAPNPPGRGLSEDLVFR